MSGIFLDPHKPLITCQAQSCEGCPVNEKIVCHFNGEQLTHFLLIMMPAFLVGGSAILKTGWIPLVIWIGLLVGYFMFAEIRVMCSHCPHYAEEGASLQCWANYGAPRLWKYRPGPMSRMETIVFFSGLVIVIGYPAVFLILSAWWFGLLLFAMMISGSYMTMRRLMCNQCINFACPLNITSHETREKFFERNPVVAEAWQPYIDLGK